MQAADSAENQSPCTVRTQLKDLESDHGNPAMQLEETKLFRTKTREGSWSDVQQQRHSFTTRVANWALDDGAGDRLPVVQSEKADSISLQPAGVQGCKSSTSSWQHDSLAPSPSLHLPEHWLSVVQSHNRWH